MGKKQPEKMEALQATDRKQWTDERQEAWPKKEKKNPKILSIYAAQHPQCLFKTLRTALLTATWTGASATRAQGNLCRWKKFWLIFYITMAYCAINTPASEAKKQKRTIGNAKPECSAHVGMTRQTIFQGHGGRSAALTIQTEPGAE